MGAGYVVFSVFGVLCGVAAVHIAGWRNRAQPIESCVGDELFVLDALESDSAQWVRAMTEMRDADFSNESRRVRYRTVAGRVEGVLDAAMRERALEANRTQDSSTLELLTSELRIVLGGSALEAGAVERFLAAGSNVISCAAGREQNTTRSAITETGNDERPYERVPSVVRRTRAVAGGVIGSVFAVIGVLISEHRWDGLGMWAGAIAMLSVAFGGILIAAVDLDTFYLDTPSFAVWAVTSWGLTLLAAWVDGDVAGIAVGVVGALGVAAGFEGIARLWGKLRGITQGAGDTWIALVTSGVPTAVSGDWRVAVWSVLAAAIGGAVHWSVLAMFRGATRETPVPFGPWLVAGGFISGALWVVGL